ncbi:MAG TPA: hypothetical protein PKC18_13990 [Lacipirellulaceae bacterium]|nr:hypothetical protein [Lacipirellulaceae bacterium]
MAVVLPIAALAAAVWGAWAAHRASLWPAVAVVVACGYVLGPPLWSAHAGPLPITVDRVLMAGLAGMMLWHWRLGRAKLPTLTAADWLLAGVLAYFTLRYLASRCGNWSLRFGRLQRCTPRAAWRLRRSGRRARR